VGTLLHTILAAAAAVGLLSAAVLLFTLRWLWRTPLAVKGRAAAGLERPPEASACVTLEPFVADVVREKLTLVLRLRFRDRVIWTAPLTGGEKKEPEPRKPGPGILAVLRALDRYWGVSAIALHFARCLRFFRIGEFSGYVEFGSGEPEQTGELYGYICAATPLWEKLPDFRFRPNWSPKQTFEFDLTVSAGFYVFQFVCSTAWFFASRFRWRELFARTPERPARRRPGTPRLPEASRRAA